MGQITTKKISVGTEDPQILHNKRAGMKRYENCFAPALYLLNLRISECGYQ